MKEIEEEWSTNQKIEFEKIAKDLFNEKWKNSLLIEKIKGFRHKMNSEKLKDNGWDELDTLENYCVYFKQELEQ